MLVFRPVTYNTDEVETCQFQPSDYILPIRQGDVIRFIVDRDLVFWKGDDTSSIGIGLSSCGMLVYENIGTFHEAAGNLYCEVVMPEDIGNCTYEVMFYSTSVPVDCGEFKGYTLQQVIDADVTLGDVINCILEDFIP